MTLNSTAEGKVSFYIPEPNEKEKILERLLQLKDSYIPLAPEIEPEIPGKLDDVEKCRICSYNVNFGCCIIGSEDSTEKTIISAIKNTKSDIIMLQETTPDWEKYFSRKT